MEIISTGKETGNSLSLNYSALLYTPHRRRRRNIQKCALAGAINSRYCPASWKNAVRASVQQFCNSHEPTRTGFRRCVRREPHVERSDGSHNFERTCCGRLAVRVFSCRWNRVKQKLPPNVSCDDSAVERNSRYLEIFTRSNTYIFLETSMIS